MSSAAANSRPEKPGNDGKHIEPSTPPAFMSLTRSSMSQQPGRISSKAVGSMPYSSLGRPATALSPMFGIFGAVEHPDVGAVVACGTTCGASVARTSRGHVVLEHVGRLDEVVVDADHDQVVGVHRCPSELAPNCAPFVLNYSSMRRTAGSRGPRGGAHEPTSTSTRSGCSRRRSTSASPSPTGRCRRCRSAPRPTSSGGGGEGVALVRGRRRRRATGPCRASRSTRRPAACRPRATRSSR